MKKRWTTRSVLWIVLLIAFSAVTVAGGTMAWFSAQVDPIENTFTAGTVEISAEETVSPPDSVKENWNPGDEAYKEYTITNIGTKCAYIRGEITGQWYLPGGIIPWNPESNPVIWEIVPESSDPGWVKVGDKIVYNESLPGTYSKATLDERQVKVTIRVKLDGEGADNTFQGKVFKLKAVFEAVQCTNGAINEVWPEDPEDPEDPEEPGDYTEVGSAWADGTPFSGGNAKYFVYNMGQGTEVNPVSINLYEGSNYNLTGQVLVWNTQDTLYIKVATDSPYSFNLTHMYPGLVPPEKHSPGQLGYINGSSYITEYTYEVSSVYTNWKEGPDERSEIPVASLDNDETIYIAVHADIYKK